jgi:hypothetical protein
MAEKHGVKMKKPGEITLESEFEQTRQIRATRYTSHERAPFAIGRYVENFCPS